MTPFARRIVTGHDESGKSIVVHDGRPPQHHSMRGPSVGADFNEIWNVPLAVPLLTSVEAHEPNERDFTIMLAAHLLRILESTHRRRAASVRSCTDADARLCRWIEGELVLLLDDSEVTLKPGDVVVQRNQSRLGKPLRQDRPRGLLPHRCAVQRRAAREAAETAGADALNAQSHAEREHGSCIRKRTRQNPISPPQAKVAAAIIVGTLFGSTVLPMMALGLLLLPMTEEFGWSRTSFSLGMSAMMGWRCPRRCLSGGSAGRAPMILGGTVLVGLMTMALSLQTGALWQFLAGFALLALGSTAVGYAVLGALFNKHRGQGAGDLRRRIEPRGRACGAGHPVAAGQPRLAWRLPWNGRDHRRYRALVMALASGARYTSGGAGRRPRGARRTARRGAPQPAFWFITWQGSSRSFPR